MNIKRKTEQEKVTVRFFFVYTIHVLLDFSITVKAATLIFISWRGSAISSAKDCSCRSSLICVHNVCLNAYVK